VRASRIIGKLRRNEPALITTLHYTDPTLYEMAILMGFYGIWMDLEHHHYSVDTAANLMRACRWPQFHPARKCWAPTRLH